MKNLKTFFTILIFITLFSSCCNATSLDEIYRDIVQSENQGYLPLFVKNRNSPDFIFEDEVPEAKARTKEDIDTVYLTNERKIRDEATRQAIQRWKEALIAVQTNNVNPANLEEIEKRVILNEPKAIELYAWMLARGVGINQDLVESFYMYQRALKLEVPNAEQNLAKVYHAMSPDQRANLKNIEE